MPEDDNSPFNPPDPELTSARTDTEAGNENLSEEDEKEKSIEALKALYARGLIKQEEYESRLEELLKS